jgi:hypothetical protein
LHNAAPDFDADGRPVLRIRKGAELVSVGISAGNISANAAAQPFTQELLEARLRAELKKGVPKASESDVTHDWDLLQKTLNHSDNELASQSHKPLAASQTRADNSGNRP